MKDLWPKDIAQAINRAPVTILKEQAALLGEKTQNIVKAEVDQVDDRLDDKRYEFSYRFYIVAPALQNYHFRLFDISHNIELYPLQLETYPDVASDIQEGSNKLRIEDENALLAVLEKIFAAPKTRRVIASLLGQSTGNYPSNESEDVGDLPI